MSVYISTLHSLPSDLPLVGKKVHPSDNRLVFKIFGDHNLPLPNLPAVPLEFVAADGFDYDGGAFNGTIIQQNGFDEFEKSIIELQPVEDDRLFYFEGLGLSQLFESMQIPEGINSYDVSGLTLKTDYAIGSAVLQGQIFNVVNDEIKFDLNVNFFVTDYYLWINFLDRPYFLSSFGNPNNNNQWYFGEIVQNHSYISGSTGSKYEGRTIELEPETIPDYPAFQLGYGANTKSSGVGLLFSFKSSTGTTESSGTTQQQINSYKYLVEVWVDDELILTQPVKANLNDVAEFDVSGIAKSLMQKYKLSTKNIENAYNHGLIWIRAIEMINGELVGEWKTSEKIDIFKARFNETELYEWNYLDHLGELLTDWPLVLKRPIKRNGNFYAGFLFTDSQNWYDNMNVKYELLNSNNSVFASDVFDCQEIFENDKGLLIKYGALNAKHSLWTSEDITIDDIESAQYFNLSFQSDNISGQTYQFEFTDEVNCASLNRGKTVHFLNKYGSMETVYLTRESRIEGEVKSFDAEVYSNEFEPTENGEITYLNLIRNTITLWSSWLHEDVYNWLVSELLESPYILIELEEGYTVRAKVLTTSYAEKKNYKNTLIDLEVKFQISELKYSAQI